MTVWLSGRPDDDEFVLLLRRLIRASYTGQVGTASAVNLTDAGGGGSVSRLPVRELHRHEVQDNAPCRRQVA
jgi:hypothetical protein